MNNSCHIEMDVFKALKLSRCRGCLLKGNKVSIIIGLLGILPCGISDIWFIIQQYVRKKLLEKSSNSCIHQKQPPEVFYKKGVLRNFVKFTGKHLCQSLFFNKVGGLRPAALSKKTLWHTCFPVNFEKFQRTPFLQKSSGRLLLSVIFAISLAQKFSLTL